MSWRVTYAYVVYLLQEVTPVDLQNNGRHDVNGPGIQHFRERMATTNGFVRNDSDPMLFNDKLTYKV